MDSFAFVIILEDKRIIETDERIAPGTMIKSINGAYEVPVRYCMYNHEYRICEDRKDRVINIYLREKSNFLINSKKPTFTVKERVMVLQRIFHNVKHEPLMTEACFIHLEHLN